MHKIFYDHVSWIIHAVIGQKTKPKEILSDKRLVGVSDGLIYINGTLHAESDIVVFDCWKIILCLKISTIFLINVFLSTNGGMKMSYIELVHCHPLSDKANQTKHLALSARRNVALDFHLSFNCFRSICSTCCAKMVFGNYFLYLFISRQFITVLKTVMMAFWGIPQYW